MSVINSIPLIAAGDDGYQISRSVRLRNSASGYFNRTFAAAGNRQKMTFSMWVKRGQLAYRALHSAGWSGSGASQGGAWINFAGDSIEVAQQTNNAYDWQVRTTPVYRDPSAWYHIVIAIDTTQATAANRVIVYVNGVQVTSYSTASYPTINLSTKFNATNQRLFALDDAGNPYVPFDGYATETFFIDGQALTPSSFGETDAITGVWKPKKYAGTYGTNGFYLNFSDNSNNTAATIGKDYSGNGNNWTPNNISVTAGFTYDSMLDVPTMWADGGNGRGNYCTLNPVFKNANTTYGVMATPIDGNLNTVSMGAGTNVYGSIDLFGNKGKWYAECRASSIASQVSIGFLSDDGNLNRGGWINSSSGVLVDNVSKGTGGFASGNTIGIAYDSINNTVKFYVNNSAVGSAYTTSTTSFNSYLFWAYTNSGVSLEWNFGQRPFAYTPPTGFKALNTQNLPAPSILRGDQHFNIALAAGASIKSAAEALFTGNELVWVKDRANANNHQLFDSVRGLSNVLQSNTTAAETTYSAPSGNSVGWAWLESVTAGFDIVTYTGTGVARTVAHSLGVAPDMMIVKNRSDGTVNWRVYHKSIGATNFLSLNLTNASAAASSVWNNTAPTSSVFSVANDGGSNGNGNNLVAYLFSEVAGFSKFGSYTGNGSTDGPFVYLGFRPRWLMVKRTDTTSNWELFDTARDTYNVAVNYLYPNLSNAESPGTGPFDFVSNGFKLRFTHANHNASGGTYIFAAFAESPFKTSLAR